jgi:hypothetical protein
MMSIETDGEGIYIVEYKGNIELWNLRCRYANEYREEESWYWIDVIDTMNDKGVFHDLVPDKIIEKINQVEIYDNEYVHKKTNKH